MHQSECEAQDFSVTGSDSVSWSFARSSQIYSSSQSAASASRTTDSSKTHSLPLAAHTACSHSEGCWPLAGALSTLIPLWFARHHFPYSSLAWVAHYLVLSFAFRVRAFGFYLSSAIALHCLIRSCPQSLPSCMSHSSWPRPHHVWEQHFLYLRQGCRHQAVCYHSCSLIYH